jgi:hypothetical protein
MTKRTRLLPMTQLWAKISDQGTPYMVGWFGKTKLMLLPVREEQSNGHTHELFSIIQDDAKPAAHQPTDPGPCPLPEHLEVSIDDGSVPF